MTRDLEAPWWRESLLLARLRRRRLLGLAGSTAVALTGGCADWFETRPEVLIEQSNDSFAASADALELQKSEGWNVGGGDRALDFEGSSAVDALGGDGWRGALETLAARLEPRDPRYRPYYVPTLFQAPAGPAQLMLRALVRPVHTVAMDADFARGLAVASLFEQAGWPTDTAVVVDAPGPRAVAFAAALAERFDPIFVFGNWPHPLGVVPSHQTLAASLYYLPLFGQGSAVRSAGAPPLWVLDANRLNAYTDETNQFDNRYSVRLPSAEELARLGVKHLLYVTEHGTGELDDLNEALVALHQAGVEVKMLALDDFERGPLFADESPDGQPLAYYLGFDVYWYGGDPLAQAAFWDDYRMYPLHSQGVCVGPPGGRRLHMIGPPSGSRRGSAHAGYIPILRPTVFQGLRSASPASPTAARPAGFGLAPIHASRADGSFAGVRFGHAPSMMGGGQFSGAHFSSGHFSGGHFSGGGFRSGSLGRVGGGGGGG